MSLSLVSDDVGSLAFPELSPEVEAIFASADFSLSFTAEVGSVEGGFDAHRSEPGAMADWETLHYTLPPGAQSCRAVTSMSF